MPASTDGGVFASILDETETLCNSVRLHASLKGERDDLVRDTFVRVMEREIAGEYADAATRAADIRTTFERLAKRTYRAQARASALDETYTPDLVGRNFTQETARQAIARIGIKNLMTYPAQYKLALALYRREITLRGANIRYPDALNALAKTLGFAMPIEAKRYKAWHQCADSDCVGHKRPLQYYSGDACTYCHEYRLIPSGPPRNRRRKRANVDFDPASTVSNKRQPWRAEPRTEPIPEWAQKYA